MTDENKDIEQVQQEEKPKSKFKSFIVNNIIHFVLLWILLLGFGFFVSSNIDSCRDSDEVVSQSLLQSLQSAAAIYVAQQREEPKVFNDFVVSKGKVTGATTLSLENIDATVKGVDTKDLELTYASTNVAKYHLDGYNVTYSYGKQEVSFKIQIIALFVSLIITLIITAVVFTLLRIIFKNYILEIIICLVVLMILLAVVVPRFQSLTKPAIYLYPEKPTEVNITLDDKIDITLDVPKYVANKGWQVMVYPDSRIVDLQPQYTNCNDLNPKTFGLEYAKEACLNNNYPYIYWEGEPANKTLPLQTKGWLVKTSNIKAFLTTKLDEVGFNEQEKAEFIRYWVHKIKASNKESVFISFMETDVIEDLLPMTVTPTPDSINRFYIIVDLNVNAHKNPQPQKLNKFKRNGFTLVDWGGAMIGSIP